MNKKQTFNLKGLDICTLKGSGHTFTYVNKTNASISRLPYLEFHWLSKVSRIANVS